MNRILSLAVAAALTMTGSVTASFAGSVLQPGATIGLAAGAPLPEGLYFVDTSSYGARDNTLAKTNINLPFVLYASPITFYDTRLQFIFLQPVVAVTNTLADRVFANSSLFSAQLAHSFGNGFNVSYLAGIRTPEPSPGAFREGSFEQRGAISYTANGFNLTANVINGLFTATRTAYPNWLNVDLTATKKFDKLEVGAIAFGSGDLNRPFLGYQKQMQIAVGGFVGYNFGKFTLQGYVSRDVEIRNYTGRETRGFARLIVPLYVAPVAPPPVVARY